MIPITCTLVVLRGIGILIIHRPSSCYPVTPYTIMDRYLVFEGAICGLCLDGMTAGQFIIM